MTCPPSPDPVDCGYRAAAWRRERVLATASPAVRARIQGEAPPYAAVRRAARITVDLATGRRTIERNVPVEPEMSQRRADRLRREIRALERERETLSGEVEHLRALRDESKEALCRRDIAGVSQRFLVELDRVGFRIDGAPVTMDQLRIGRRARVWARPRMTAMWLCLSLVRGASLEEVGQFFGRDHTTVMYARAEIEGVFARHATLADAAFATFEAFEVEPHPLLLGIPCVAGAADDRR